MLDISAFIDRLLILCRIVIVKCELIVLERGNGFDMNVPGFRADWWQYPSRQSHDDIDDVKLMVKNEEIARAKIEKMRYSLSELYSELSGIQEVYKVCLFEVRDSFRRRGIGCIFAEILTNHYAPASLIAFSEDADEFWGSLGWARCQRNDGNSRCQALFVKNI